MPEVEDKDTIKPSAMQIYFIWAQKYMGRDTENGSLAVVDNQTGLDG